MYIIKDILTKKFVSGIIRKQGSPMINLGDITDAKKYNSYGEAKKVIDTQLCVGFEVVLI
jgi:hypothetical protein